MNLSIPLNCWSLVREGLYQALDLLSDDQVHFSPKEGLWSLGQIALHIASTEDGWFRHVIRNELPDWPKDLELKDHRDVAAIKAALEEVHRRTANYLSSVNEAELERVIKTSWEEEFPVRSVIWHILEHEIHHRGEIYLMLGLLGKEAPDV